MIRWCSYCQKFLGDFPPFENKSFSHGICANCETIGLTASSDQVDRMKYLVDLNSRFWRAGSTEDHKAIVQLAEEGMSQGIRPIDILFGIAAPMLVTVGEMWEKNLINHTDEAHFTRAVESLTDLIAQRINLIKYGEKNAAPHVLLANVFGNEHLLGNRFVQIGIASMGIPSKILSCSLEPAALVAKVVDENFKCVGLSIALSSQASSLRETLVAFKNDKDFSGRILVGGSVINQSMIDENQFPNVFFLQSPSFSEAERSFWVVDDKAE